MLTKQMYEAEILRKVRALPESELPKVISLLDRLEEEERKKKAEEYRKAIDRAWGLFAHLPGSVDDFMKRKEEEKKLDR